MGYRIEFEGLESYIEDEDLKEETFDVCFGSSMMVRFQVNEDLITAINGVDEWGNNIREQVYGREAKIY